jgi:Ni/Co efflux regulator RcnB
MEDDMNTKLTLLAVLLLAGASQAALAQEHDHDRWVEPGQAQPHAAPGGEHHANGGPPHAQPQPGAPAAAPHGPPNAAPGHWDGADHRGPGAERRQFQAQGTVPGPVQNGQVHPGQVHPGQVQPGPAGPAPHAAPPPGVRVDQGDRRWDGRNDFAPGGTANGDPRWARRDAPREVVPPGPNAEQGWDRDHDGHQPGRQAWDHRYDGRYFDRNGHAPPANWRRWDHNRYPPIYAAAHRYHVAPYHRPYGWFVRSWGFGDYLPGGWFAPDYWVDDFWDYDLPYPPPGFHWVRVGDDALLVDDYSGRILQVVRDIFW